MICYSTILRGGRRTRAKQERRAAAAAAAAAECHVHPLCIRSGATSNRTSLMRVEAEVTGLDETATEG